MIPKVVFESIEEGVKSILKIIVVVLFLVFVLGVGIGYLL